MKNFYLILLSLLFVGFGNSVNAQNISNEGSEFWIPFPTHDPSGNDLANMNVFVTCRSNSEVTVSCGASYSETKKIPANTIVAFSVPRNGSYISSTEANTPLVNRAIHVITKAGAPDVAVYAHIYAGFRSAASLILPKESLGPKYYSMNYDQDQNGKNFLVLVAVEDNTTLLLHELNGTTRSIFLAQAGDVYEYMPNNRNDLTGTFVEVDPSLSPCKRFAAFSGSTSNTIVCTGSRDPLYQQLYTVANWGKNYGVVPFINRQYNLRVLAQEDNTKVKVDGVTYVVNKGKYFELSLENKPMIVTADKLISVAQYSLTQSCSGAAGNSMSGDPDMVLLNPTEFNIKNITVFSSNNKEILSKYVNVFMKTAKTSTFKINGMLPNNGTWHPMPDDPSYSYIQVEVFDESLTLTADDGFNAIAYGFGNAESYAYSAGTNLASSQYLILVNKVTKAESNTACLNETVDFKLTLPYLLDKIVWKLGDSDPDYLDPNPTPTVTVVNGQTLYTYFAPVNKSFNTLGKKNLSALATLSAAPNACFSGEVEFNFTVQIDPFPTADFSVAGTGCTDVGLTFTDKSTSNSPDRLVSKWQWDFGDGSAPSEEQNPTHTYASSGTYIVKLFVGNDIGCYSDVKEIATPIVINTTPKALFTLRSKTCVNTPLAFTDQSTIGGGEQIVKWDWKLKDGTVISDRQNTTYSFTSPGEYEVILVVYGEKGCASQPFSQKITVTPLPTIDFSLPEVCIADKAIFTNSSKDSDGSINGLTYLWDFGDPSSGANNTATTLNGDHKYSAPGDYTVTLTIFNLNGCSVSLSKQFTVNGAAPRASFDLANDAVCSNTSFSATNTSTVDFGKITRIEWYIDGVSYSVDEDPNPGKIYNFSYPPFMAPATKVINLKMVAYSGSVFGSCSDNLSKTVTLKASPVVEFNALSPVCVNGGMVQFNATELGHFSGGGQFSGDGVTASGMFNPALAKVGTHNITYTFTATNGCTDSKTQQIEVYPAPVIDAGEDFYILSGGEKQMNASAKGMGLTYKWTPSTGLDHDDILNPVASPEIDTKYTLTVTSSQGCFLSDEVEVKVLQHIIVPNTFTPNGDGVNDVWNVKYLDTYPNATVEIYDRNGQRVFYSKGYTKPFDGFYQNQSLPIGTYYYIISPNSGRKKVTGDVTIIR